MVAVRTADGAYHGAFETTDGRVTAPFTPGLGIIPRLDTLGDPVASYP